MLPFVSIKALFWGQICSQQIILQHLSKAGGQKYANKDYQLMILVIVRIRVVSSFFHFLFTIFFFFFEVVFEVDFVKVQRFNPQGFFLIIFSYRTSNCISHRKVASKFKGFVFNTNRIEFSIVKSLRPIWGHYYWKKNKTRKCTLLFRWWNKMSYIWKEIWVVVKHITKPRALMDRDGKFSLKKKTFWDLFWPSALQGFHRSH